MVLGLVYPTYNFIVQPENNYHAYHGYHTTYIWAPRVQYSLCTFLFTGMQYIHGRDIIHRDLKSSSGMKLTSFH